MPSRKKKRIGRESSITHDVYDYIMEHPEVTIATSTLGELMPWFQNNQISAVLRYLEKHDILERTRRQVASKHDRGRPCTVFKVIKDHEPPSWAPRRYGVKKEVNSRTVKKKKKEVVKNRKGHFQEEINEITSQLVDLAARVESLSLALADDFEIAREYQLRKRNADSKVES